MMSLTVSSAQSPLYIVGGKAVESIDHIAQSDIDSIETLPADEETIARYGERASNGVIVVHLRYDTPARFEAGSVDWDERMPAAKISLRYRVATDGSVVAGDILLSTDKRLLRRVLRAMERAPRWTPAMRDECAVESEHLLNLLLPEGGVLPPERGVILL